MTRHTALRVFGLDDTASDAAVWAAYSALRRHLEARVRAAEAMARTGAAAFYHQQLREAEAALELAIGPKLSPSSGRAHGQGRNAVLLVGFLLAAAIALQWGMGRLGAPGPPVGSLARSVDAESTVPVAELAIRGNMEGAMARVISKESTETVWQGAADGRLRAVSPGDYTLVVEHPGCPDPWTEDVRLEAGQRVERIARNCAQHALLAVRANIDGGHLVVDGRDLGSPGEREHVLPVGRHQIRVEREGHAAWEASVDLAPAARVSLRANLLPRAVAAARVRPAVASSGPQVASAAPDREELAVAHDWHRTARQYLLARYDSDRSGHLDSLDEIRSVPCSDWRGIERSFDESGLSLSMVRFYGFDGSKWVVDAFGVTSDVRGETYLRLKDCGLR